MRHGGKRGFTLIEVLVALFVLAVGVIGACAAQNIAAQTRHASAQLASATAQVTALAERMAANPAQLALPDADNVYLQAAQEPWHCAGACTPAQLAAIDRDDAAALAARSFPGGRVRVCRDTLAVPLAWDCATGPGAALVVKIGWRAPAFIAMAAVPVPEAP